MAATPRLMERGFLDALALFALPFLAYAIWLALRRRYPFLLRNWTEGPLAMLVVAGLALAILGTLVTGFVGNRHRGGYVPAHVENGVLVPGRLQ